MLALQSKSLLFTAYQETSPMVHGWTLIRLVENPCVSVTSWLSDWMYQHPKRKQKSLPWQMSYGAKGLRQRPPHVWDYGTMYVYGKVIICEV